MKKQQQQQNGSFPKLYMILHWDSQNRNNCVGKEIGATDFQPTRAHNIPPRKTELETEFHKNKQSFEGEYTTVFDFHIFREMKMPLFLNGRVFLQKDRMK